MKSKKHLQAVSELPCCVCGIEGVQVHHIRGAGLTGASQRASDMFTIPLCAACHTGYHARPAFWQMQNGLQVDFLAKTLHKLLYEGDQK